MKQFNRLNIFIPLLPRILLALGLLSGSMAPAHAADDSCRILLQSLFPSKEQEIAQRILSEYEPFRSEAFELTPLFLGNHGSVFRGRYPARPTAAPFVIKVSPLHEAINDYVALRVLRKAQERSTVPVTIVRGTLLPPRTGELTMITPVVQRNPFVEGRPLIEILADPLIPMKQKLVLKQHFRKWVDQMRPLLMEDGFNASREEAQAHFFQKHLKTVNQDPELLATMPGMLMADKPWSTLLEQNDPLLAYLARVTAGEVHRVAADFEDIQLILKTDNIIVSEEGEFILFDPF